jgi:hypothetical protein
MTKFEFFLFVLFLILCLFLFFQGKRALERRRILHFGDRAEEEVSLLLKNAFPRGIVLNGLYLKRRNRITQIDHILLCSYGVFVIETKSHNGYIEASGETWVQHWNGKVVPFHSPILQNGIHRRMVEDLLGNWGIEKKIPVFDLIVFTSNKVEFSRKEKSLVSTKDLVSRIKALGKGKRSLTKTQLYQVKKRILAACVRSASEKRAHRRQMQERNG